MYSVGVLIVFFVRLKVVQCINSDVSITVDCCGKIAVAVLAFRDFRHRRSSGSVLGAPLCKTE